MGHMSTTQQIGTTLLGNNPGLGQWASAKFGLVAWPAPFVAGATKRAALQNGVLTPALDADIFSTPAQPFGGGLPANSYNGTSQYDDFYSAAFKSAFNPSECTVITLMQVANTGVWTDGIARMLVRMLASGDNFITLRKSSINNEFNFIYEANNIRQTITKSTLTLDRVMVAMTASDSNDQVIGIFNDEIVDTQNGVGTWVGGLLSYQTVIGAGSTAPVNVWSGLISDVIVHPTRAMEQSEIAEIYRRWGG